jgi:hypothetical protein
MSSTIAAKLKRCLWAVLVGGAVASIPWLGSLTENDQIIAVTGFVLLPGIIPGMAAGGGGVHDASWTVTIWASVVFWIGLAYVFLSWRERRESTPASKTPKV